MNSTATRVEGIVPIQRSDVRAIASAENRRVYELIASLEGDDWAQPTDCTLWDVRALASHVLGGLEVFGSVREFVHQMRGGEKAKGDGPFIDGMTSLQVRERAGLTHAQLRERLERIGPRAARNRARMPWFMRRRSMDETVDGQPEKWPMAYLFDTILTRDTWMHRVDIARATGREMVLTADHDGWIIADVVAEWARRHGQPFTLNLEGPAGGTYVHGEGGETITIDAVEFCRVLSGRGTGAGLLQHHVPF
jgi:uncharacterized protein (TIGR03083 family)